MTTYPINETMFGLRFRTFEFTGNTETMENIFLHCKVIVCDQKDKADSRCDRTCASGRQGRDVSQRMRRNVQPVVEVEVDAWIIELYTDADLLPATDLGALPTTPAAPAATQNPQVLSGEAYR